MQCVGPFAPAAPRELIQDPRAGCRFVFSSTGKANHLPEFLLLDTPNNQDLMVSCSKIFSNYEDSDTAPTDLEIVTATPFQGDPEMRFIARVIDSDSQVNRLLKQGIEKVFLYHEKTAGIIVMIPHPHMQGEDFWGQGPPGALLDEGVITAKRCNTWIANEIMRAEEN